MSEPRSHQKRTLRKHLTGDEESPFVELEYETGFQPVFRIGNNTDEVLCFSEPEINAMFRHLEDFMRIWREDSQKFGSKP